MKGQSRIHLQQRPEGQEPMPGPQDPKLLFVLLTDVLDGKRAELMVSVMLVVRVEGEAAKRVILLKAGGADVVLRSRVMLGNWMERGIAAIMPTARAMNINYILAIRIRN